MAHRSSIALGFVLFAAACGGKAAAPATPVTATPPVAEAPREVRADPCGGDSYGGAMYGAVAYGGEGGFGDPCGGDMPPPAAPGPVDPPEIGDYLPPSASAPAGLQDQAVTYAVPIHDSPALGAAVAPVTMVVTYEFADPFGDRLRPTIAELSTRYGKDLRVVWKHFIVHRNKVQASALAGCAADKQGKFRPFMNAMFDAATGPNGDHRYDLEAIRVVASAQQLDAARFDKDLHSKACKDAVIRDQQLFESLGQRAVPVTYVNGRPLQGAQPIDAFATLIDEELAKAKAAFAKGTKPAKYYAGLVKSGKTAP